MTRVRIINSGQITMLLVAVGLVLSGCGGGGGGGITPGGGGAPTPVPTANPTEKPTPKPTPKPELFYVSSVNSVREYALSSSNVVSQVGEITGLQTGITTAYGIALDAQNNIYVATTAGQTSEILEFAAGALGNVAPIAEISGNLTEIQSPLGIAVDPSGNIWVTSMPSNPGMVLEFAPGSTGNVAPIATIGGSNTGFGFPMGVATDSHRNVYVTQGCNQCGPYAFVEFAAGSNGNVAPIAVEPTTGAGSAGITVTSTGAIYASLNGITEVSAPAAGGLNFTPVSNLPIGGTIGIATDAAGRVFVAAGGNPFQGLVPGVDTAIYQGSLGGSALTSVQTPSWGVAIVR